jgi:hypothetical protein
MSAAAVARGGPAPRFRDTLAAECVKIATLRAVAPLLALASAIAVGAGAILAAAAARAGAAGDRWPPRCRRCRMPT